MRARIMAIVTLFTMILWSFGEGHKAMASRQLAKDASSEWNAQEQRLAAAREAWLARQAKAQSAPATAIPEPVVGALIANASAGRPGQTAESQTSTGNASPSPRPATEEPVQLVATLRASLAHCKVRVEECRIGAGRSEGGRTLRLKLVGSKDALKKAILVIRSDPRISKLTDATFEPIRRGEARALLTGALRQKGPSGRA